MGTINVDIGTKAVDVTAGLDDGKSYVVEADLGRSGRECFYFEADGGTFPATPPTKPHRLGNGGKIGITTASDKSVWFWMADAHGVGTLVISEST